MLDSAIQSNVLPQAKYLWFFMLSFAMIISISNWYDARLVSILGFAISPGTLSYPLSFLVSDSITEVYGYKKARLAIWAVLFFNVLFLLFGQLVIHLPSPSFAIENDAFDKLLSMNFWIICGSFISFLIAEPCNSYLIAKLKIAMDGKYTGIRFISSTVIAAFLDSLLFISIAFHQTLTINNIFTMTVNVWLIKVAIEILFIPVSVRITKWLKEKEELDVYDHQTKFNIFSLDATYQNETNHYFNKVQK